VVCAIISNKLAKHVRNVFVGLVVKIRGLIRKAKFNWLATRYEGLGRFPCNYWDHIADLKKGLTAWKDEDKIPLFKNKGGTKCKTLEQNKKVLVDHWKNVFNLPCIVDPDVLERVKQRPIIEALGRLPTDKEIVECTRKAKKGKAPGDNRIRVEFWQALLPEGNLNEDSVVLLYRL
jgi:hypothetical protein